MKILYALAALCMTLTVLYFCCRIFVADRFRIPTESMEPTLVPGDVVIVNKLLAGARIYTDLHFSKDGVELKSLRMRGLRPIRHNDIVVFNQANHKGKIKFVINNVYCKRCIGLPGDTVSIVDGWYRNNNYNGLLGIAEEQRRMEQTPDSMIPRKCLRAMPRDKHVRWTIRNFGPMYIPRKGDVMDVTPETATIYRVILEWETGGPPDIDWERNRVMVAGGEIRRHRFRHNYYFMAGDNVMNSDDSRYKGPVPEEYIVGIVGWTLH